MTKKIYGTYYKALNKAYPLRIDDTGLDYWRNRLFIRMLTFFLPVSAIVVGLGIFMSIAFKLYMLAAAEILSLTCMIVSAFAPGLSINTRKLLFVVVIHVMSVILLYYLGAWGPGMSYLLAGTFFTVLIFPHPAGLISTITIAIVCMLFAFAFNMGAISTPGSIQYSAGGWLTVSINTVALSALIVLLLPPLFVKLQKAAERFRLVAMATSDTIWEWNLAHDRITYSSGLTTTFGYNPADLRASQEWWMSRIHPDDLLAVQSAFGSAVEAPGDLYIKVSCRFLAAQGVYKNVIIRATVLPNEEGKVEKIVGSMQDVSEMEKYISDIEKQNEALKSIAWVQSHKVRSPVATMLGLSALLKEDNAESIDNRVIIDGITACCNELDGVIKEITTLAQKGEA